MESNQSAHWENFYEKAWGLRKSLAEQFVKLGVSDPYQLVQKLYLCEGRYTLDLDEKTNKVSYKEQTFPKEERLFPTGKPYYKYISLGEQVAAIPFYSSCVDFLLDYLDARKFDAIVELGSGYGQNLIELFYRGGPANTPYYAAEYSASGVEMTKYLVSLRNDLPIVPFRFDYKNPDLSPVKEKKNILIFTSHSIEQVREVSEDLFSYLADFAESVTCIHFEPFGFQVDEKPEDRGDASKLQALVFKEKDWNQNLWPTLVSCNQKKIIRMTFLAKNVMGKELGNPTSVAIWENLKVQSSASS